jgi:hypothetical protein
MKTGASEIEDFRHLHCFDPDPGFPFAVELGSHGELQDSLEFFREGETAGGSPFGRTSLAVSVGRSAGWPLSGRRPPLTREIEVLNPAWALISFGTNDLNLGLSPLRAVDPYFENLTALVDRLTDEGVVPVVFGPGMRADSQGASRWTHVYNVVTRGIAEARQVPYVDLTVAFSELPGYGLARDGVHGNAWVDEVGRAQPCVFNEAALEFYYNTRNLLTLEVLAGLRLALVEEEPLVVEDPPWSPLEGQGTAQDPFVIDRLPFAHMARTDEIGERRVDAYGCGRNQDLSGPEVVYRLELEESLPLRVLVVDRDEADIDVHLLNADQDPEACHGRDDRILAGRVPLGTYHLALDSYVEASGRARPGEYLLVVMPCEEDDADCEAPLVP